MLFRSMRDLGAVRAQARLGQARLAPVRHAVGVARVADAEAHAAAAAHKKSGNRIV